MSTRHLRWLALPAVLLLLVCAGCAAGTARFESAPAGFWNGLWHGLIMIITFVIGLFSDTVRMYEPKNVGPLYDLGFVLGAMICLGGGACNGRKKKKVRVCVSKDEEWAEIGERVEVKVKKGIQSWLDEENDPGQNWEEIGRKVEAKIKRELSNWADE